MDDKLKEISYKSNEESPTSLDDALTVTGFGKYNIFMLVTCCFLVLAMCVDIFGFSIVLPPAACDMRLNTQQQGLLSAIPLIGVMISSYFWGLCADTLGRRTTLLITMPLGIILNVAAGFAPSYTLLTVLKFFSACFTSSSMAAAFVLCGESTPREHRSKFMFLMATTTMLGQLVIGIFALPIFRTTFRIQIACFGWEYRPWRLLMQINSLPGLIGLLGVIFCHESPKFLLSKGQEVKAIKVLKSMYGSNTGGNKKHLTISSVSLDEAIVTTKSDDPFLHKL